MRTYLLWACDPDTHCPLGGPHSFQANSYAEARAEVLAMLRCAAGSDVEVGATRTTFRVAGLVFALVSERGAFPEPSQN